MQKKFNFIKVLITALICFLIILSIFFVAIYLNAYLSRCESVNDCSCSEKEDALCVAQGYNFAQCECIEMDEGGGWMIDEKMLNEIKNR